MFQKVASKAEESFLIKDYNGNCARIDETETQNEGENRIYSIWRTCRTGGFTIFKLTREGKHFSNFHLISISIHFIFTVNKPLGLYIGINLLIKKYVYSRNNEN